MRKISFLFILIVFILQSCGTLHSTATIEPNSSLLFGEGQHAKYTATVENVGESDIAVFQRSLEGANTALGILSVGTKAKYSIPRNSTVRFKNSSQKKVVIKITAKGDSKLSMGYKEN